MLDGMYRPLMERRLTIGLFHANVERSDFFATHLVATTDIDATQQPLVVYSKTGYLFHLFTDW